MVKLELANDEAQVLVEFLQSKLSDLSYEIRDTDTMEYREELKSKRDALTRVLEALSPPGART